MDENEIRDRLTEALDDLKNAEDTDRLGVENPALRAVAWASALAVLQRQAAPPWNPLGT